MSLSKFSSNLKELMKSENISRRMLAAKVGIERKSLLNWLNGIYYPRYDALIKIADFFKVDIDYLIGLKENCCEKEYKLTCKMEQVPHKFCEKVNIFLQREQKSKYWLAKKLNVGQTTISRWFEYGGMPEITTLVRLSLLMNEPLDYLLSRE